MGEKQNLRNNLFPKNKVNNNENEHSLNENANVDIG